MLLKEILVENSFITKDFLFNNKDVFANIAQKVYDEWDENMDEYGGGGICHLIADEICDYLDNKGFECITVNTCVGENHVFVVVKTDDGVYEVDIPPNTYETGGGYNWEKIPNVQFDENDVVVSMIDSDPNSFERNYAEDY